MQTGASGAEALTVHDVHRVRDFEHRRLEKPSARQVRGTLATTPHAAALRDGPGHDALDPVPLLRGCKWTDVDPVEAAAAHCQPNSSTGKLKGTIETAVPSGSLTVISSWPAMTGLETRPRSCQAGPARR